VDAMGYLPYMGLNETRGLLKAGRPWERELWGRLADRQLNTALDDSRSDGIAGKT